MLRQPLVVRPPARRHAARQELGVRQGAGARHLRLGHVQHALEERGVAAAAVLAVQGSHGAGEVFDGWLHGQQMAGRRCTVKNSGSFAGLPLCAWCLGKVRDKDNHWGASRLCAQPVRSNDACGSKH